MKKLLFTFVALFAFVASYAQFEKGTIMAGGSVGFSTSTEKYEDVNTPSTTTGKLTEITFSPKAGYFIIDKLALGAGVTFASSKFEDDAALGGGSNTVSGFSLDPFARYYFGPVYGQFEFSFGSLKDKNDDGAGNVTESKYKASGWSLSVGYPIFLNGENTVSLEPAVGYGSRSQTEDITGDPKFTNSGLFLQIGLQVYIRR